MNVQSVNELHSMWYGESLWSVRARWELLFCWFPRRCAISKKLIWLDFAYCGTLGFAGPGEPVIEHRWHDADEHLVWLLKQ
jgi:hypothetical protein